jgi:hypothetical protein
VTWLCESYSVSYEVRFRIFVHGFHPLCALVFPLKVYFRSLLPRWILMLFLFLLSESVPLPRQEAAHFGSCVRDGFSLRSTPVSS